MQVMERTKVNVATLAEELGPEIARRSAARTSPDDFVEDNYTLLKEHGVFSALVPEELGGGGASHAEMCDLLRGLANYCSSTALSVSMHQHLVAANVWKFRHQGESRELLENVAANELVLVSTGARDWLESNGTVEKVAGGYRVSAKKAFASGSPAGNFLVTSAPYEDPEAGWQVLHFPVPMSAEGVRVGSDWMAMGMCGTGSHTVTLENVFVPEEAVGLRRPQGEYHPFWTVVLTVAMPLISSVYVGIAERAAGIALGDASRKAYSAPLALLLGELENEKVQAQLALGGLIGLANDYDFKPSDALASDILVRKTLAIQASIRTVEKAMETVGAISFRRDHPLEALFRDVQAGEFHPLSRKRQQHFTGRVALGLDPIE